MLKATISGDKGQTFMDMVGSAWGAASQGDQDLMAASEKKNNQLHRIEKILRGHVASRIITLSGNN